MKKITLALPFLLSALNTNAQPKPNIVILIVDDLGWADLGYRNSKFQTPNVDQLKAEGLEFTHAYISTPTSSPSRASLLTGKEAVRLQLVRHIYGSEESKPDPKIEIGKEFQVLKTDPVHMPSRNYLPLEEITYAERLKEFGYYNMFVGKWHLGDDEAYWPSKQGFDEEYCTGEVFHKSFKPYYQNKNKTGIYKTDSLTNKTVQLIRDYDKNQPFMLSLYYYDVHGPHQGRTDWVEYYKKQGLTGVDAEYAAMVSVMDESVGRVRKALQEKGIAENTIILFSSDQGGAFKNANLSGGKYKNTLGEGGSRVPFILYYPGVTKPNTTCDTPIQTIDFYPTLMEIVSGKKCKEKQIQGVSLMPVLQGKSLKNRKFYFFRSYEDQYAAVRDGDWKLVKYHSGKYELFNLKDDESEQNNLIEKELKIAAKMKKNLSKWEHKAVPKY